jgi:hypothetical protein
MQGMRMTGGGMQAQSPISQQRAGQSRFSLPQQNVLLRGGGLQFGLSQNTMFAAGISMQQPNATFGAGLQMQPNVMLALALQQQQQNAMILGWQRPMQANGMLAAVQPQLPKVWPAPQPQPQLQNAVLPELRANVVPERHEPAPIPEPVEDTAARKLKLARTFLKEAIMAQAQGERNEATKLREKAGARLQEIVGKFAGTSAAEVAQGLLDELERQF